MTKELVRLSEITRSYQFGEQRFVALDAVSLLISQGSFLAVMGASGSGKSTLLSILGCLDRASSGTYEIDGEKVERLGDDALSELRLRRFGFIFQSFHLIPQLTVAENIELPMYYLNWPASKSRHRARELADRMGLGERLQHRPAQLSGGQQQRVAIARALANDPLIILADEPTGNLDSETSAQIMRLLQELNRQGKTIVMVTHEEDMAAFAGEKLIMKDGRIVNRIASGNDSRQTV